MANEIRMALGVNPIEESKMLRDIDEHGNEIRGEFKGISYLLRRPYGTYWCGYLLPPEQVQLSDEAIAAIESSTHGGLTASLGFDCAHWNDYPTDPNGKFRGYDYVMDVIQRMVDSLLAHAASTMPAPASCPHASCPNLNRS
ncbi:MAG: hypothetical protein ACYCOU_03130 [Sulfobacillus sp.]